MTYSLYLGDCLEYMKSMPDKSVDAVITDPPYGIGVTKMTLGNGPRIYRGEHNWDNKRVDLGNIIQLGKVICIWGGNYYTDCLPVSRGWLIWDKKNGGQLSCDYADCEMAWTNQDISARLIRHIWDGAIQQDMKNKESRVHPTQKPIAVMRWCINILTKRGDTIFDPFMGSGTTGVACMQLGRNFIGCEIDPKYYAIAEKRIKQAAEQEPLFLV